jgi:hypothetical protein
VPRLSGAVAAVKGIVGAVLTMMATAHEPVVFVEVVWPVGALLAVIRTMQLGDTARQDVRTL